VHVPVLQGTNANEGRLFEPDPIFAPQSFPFPADVPLATVIAAGGPANYDLNNPNDLCAVNGTPAVCSYPQEIAIYLPLINVPSEFLTPAFAAQLAATYPLADFPDPFLPNNAPDADEALSQIFTDFIFACNGSDSNIDLSSFVPVFGYEFNDPNAPPLLGPAVEPPNDVFGFPSASSHGEDFLYLFTFAGLTEPFNAGEQQLAEEMKTYWANFVKTGDPNLPRPDPVWLPFDVSQALQDLVPGPAQPHPFFDFRAEHFCDTVWQPVLAAEPQR
jgi:para-nitrobenzyl esterase